MEMLDGRRPRRDSVLAGALAGAAVLGTVGFIVGFGASQTTRVAMLAGAVVAHLVLVLPGRLRSALPAGMVVALSAAALVAVMIPVPRGTDLWAYQMYGRIVTEHGQNPYDLPPGAFPDDPVLPRMEGSWTGARAYYGPALVATSVVVAQVTGEYELAGRLAWQGLCAASVFVGVVLLWRRGCDGAAIAALGLNPLVLYQLVHLAHIDAIIGTLVLGAVLLARDERDVGAAILLTLAALIKAPAGIALVVLLAWVLVRRGPWRAGLAAVVSGVLGIGAIVMAGGLRVIAPMLGARGATNSFTPWNLFQGGAAVFTGNSMPDVPSVSGSTLSTLALGVSAAFAVVLSGVRIARPDVGERDDPSAVVSAALLVWLLLSLYTSPWSFGWVLPITAWTLAAWWSRGVLLYVGWFAVTAQWGILTVVAKWMDDPSFARRDDLYALLKGSLLVGLLVLLALLALDTVLRARRGRGLFAPHEPTSAPAVGDSTAQDPVVNDPVECRLR